MSHHRRNLAEQILALLGGLALGLLIAWVIAPVQYTDAPPSLLRADFKDEYRLLVARAWQSTQDLPRAQTRLAVLGDASPAQALALQAQTLLGEGGDENDIAALAALSSALRSGPTPTPTKTATPGPTATPSRTLLATWTPSPTLTASPTATRTQTPTAPPPIPTLEGTPGTPAWTLTPSRTPSPTITPTRTPRIRPTITPTPTPTVTPGLPFVVIDETEICDPSQTAGLLQIYVRDAANQPVAGVTLQLEWPPDQKSVFYTGLKPEIDPGYADARLESGITYALSVYPGGTYIPGLQPPLCTSPTGETYPGSLRLLLRQP